MSELTCRIVRDGKEIFSSSASGIAPLMFLAEYNVDVSRATAFDKIVGKAAALIYALLKIYEVNADVISADAVKVFREYKIPFTYKTITEKIVNRKGDGICPMEQTVANIDDPHEAYIALKEKLKEMAS